MAMLEQPWSFLLDLALNKWNNEIKLVMNIKYKDKKVFVDYQKYYALAYPCFYRIQDFRNLKTDKSNHLSIFLLLAILAQFDII